MKIIERYVFGSFLSSFTLAFLVLSFVLTVGLMVKIVGYILDGVQLGLVGQFAMVSFPETMQWTIPLALLVSSVLVFSRMSADSEVAAMRACGINIWSVMKWPIVFGLLCTLLGFWINNEIVPRGHEVRNALKTRLSVGTAIDMLEPGRMIDDFPKMKIYFESKEGNWIHDLVVFDYSSPKVERQITAAKALVTGEGRDINLDLYQMTVDPLDEAHPTMAHMSRYKHVIKDALRDSKYTKKVKDMRFRELVRWISARSKQVNELRARGDSPTELKLLRRERSRAKVELSKRFVFAMASICFVMIGIPLGIRAQRKESSIGMAIALGVSLSYYMVVILMISLQKNYSIHPEFLIWLPVIVSSILAAGLVRKHL